MIRRNRRAAAPAAADAELTRTRRIVYAVASRLLQYPDEQLLDEVPALLAATAGLPAQVREPLRRMVSHVMVTPLLEQQKRYVATFDMKRKCCLYLTYYLNGDTRRRGMALLRFRQTYSRCGLVLDTGELPDFLPMVLEFAVAGEEDVAVALLDEHRAGLEVLARALRDLRTPYEGVVDAVLATLPELDDERRAAALALAAQGPPVEEVGLEPFALLPAEIGVRS